MSFHLWKIFIILDSLLDSEDKGIMFLLNSVTVYQLTLCDIPKHLDRHEHLCEDLKSLIHDRSFDSFMPQLIKKNRIFCFNWILIYQKSTASFILFHCKHLTSNHSFLSILTFNFRRGVYRSVENLLGVCGTPNVKVAEWVELD
jgi:hypothetical protein